MAEPEKFTFSYPEIAEALVKKQGIHDGIWGIMVQFGIGAANVAKPDKTEQMLPAAIVPVIAMGIQKFKDENSLTVDAAKVNPRPKRKGAKAKNLKK